MNDIIRRVKELIEASEPVMTVVEVSNAESSGEGKSR